MLISMIKDGSLDVTTVKSIKAVDWSSVEGESLKALLRRCTELESFSFCGHDLDYLEVLRILHSLVSLEIKSISLDYDSKTLNQTNIDFLRAIEHNRTYQDILRNNPECVIRIVDRTI